MSKESAISLRRPLRPLAYRAVGIFCAVLVGILVSGNSFTYPGCIGTSVIRDNYQYCSFTLWYHIPAVPGSCVALVWERDWEWFELATHKIVLRHTSDWTLTGIGIDMHPGALWVTVEIICYQDTSYIDDVVLLWSHNKLPNPGFERWSLGEPVGWGTTNRGHPGSVFKSRNAHSGRSSVGLVNTVVGVEDDVDRRPDAVRFGLRQNEPNPFNSSTLIQYTIPVACPVKLTVHDVTGGLTEALVEGHQEPGNHQVRWNADTRSAGIYFYMLKAGHFTDTKKMILVRPPTSR